MNSRTWRASSTPLIITTVFALSFSPAFAEENADPEYGAYVFKKCRACHMIGEKARNAVGPVLTNVVGRTAGSVEGYTYSDNMRELGVSGLKWTADKLDQYLTDPKVIVPRGKMAFPGLKDAQDRADLIACLREFARQ